MHCLLIMNIWLLYTTSVCNYFTMFQITSSLIFRKMISCLHAMIQYFFKLQFVSENLCCVGVIGSIFSCSHVVNGFQFYSGTIVTLHSNSGYVNLSQYYGVQGNFGGISINNSNLPYLFNSTPQSN